MLKRKSSAANNPFEINKLQYPPINGKLYYHKNNTLLSKFSERAYENNDGKINFSDLIQSAPINNNQKDNSHNSKENEMEEEDFEERSDYN